MAAEVEHEEEGVASRDIHSGPAGEAMLSSLPTDQTEAVKRVKSRSVEVTPMPIC